MNKTKKCRCCLSSECQKDLSNSYMSDGKLENYGEMLTNTFNLTLNCHKKYICEECITRLKDAARFKQQILDVEITLNKLTEQEIILENSQDRIILDDGDDFSCEAWLPEVKTEDEIFDIKSEPTEDIPRSEDFIKNKSSSMKEREHKLKRRKETDRAKCTKLVKKKPQSPEKEDQRNQRENSIKLISNSNICIFKSLRTRFACYVCNEKYFDIKELRSHSKVHTADDFKRRFRRLRGKSYENVDITNLTCRICSENCSNLDILRVHLIENHDISFGDANHILIPFKLAEGFKCEICKDSFNTFTRLSIHMNSHATSNVCETCGMAFFNRISLRNHIRSIHKEHKCSLCPLKFSTTTKLVCHKRKVHNAAPVKHYCLRCQLTFSYPYLLKNHMVEKHGAKFNTVECSSCKKVFKDNNFLKTHFRSVHLNERNFSCTLCDLRFFTRTDRKRHEKTHEGVSSFSCNLCETKFKSKDSVGRHMKRQHGDTISK